MPPDLMVMTWPAWAAFGLLLVGVTAHLIGDAVQGVIDCRRRWDQRDRELVVLEAFHALGHPRPGA